MANKTILALVIDEMMENAAKEIDVEHCQENIDQVVDDLDNHYGIKVDYNGKITAEFMNCLTQIIIEWKQETVLNYKA